MLLTTSIGENTGIGHAARATSIQGSRDKTVVAKTPRGTAGVHEARVPTCNVTSVRFSKRLRGCVASTRWPRMSGEPTAVDK